jgi:hypothetical protein
MPYSNVPDNLQDQMESCVQKVMAQGHDKESAIRICHASIVQGKSLDAARREYLLDALRPQPPLNLSYAKSLALPTLPDLAVKATGADEISGYSHLWGSERLTDVEIEYFTRDTDFWDKVLSGSIRPLTWDHGQDKSMQAPVVIGQIVDFGDDDVGRWYVAKLDRAHRYRKAIDELIRAGRLGTSSDSAPQYVERVKTGKATWLKTWPFFAAALTDTPAEPRMLGDGAIEFLKSSGIALPDALHDAARLEQARMKHEILSLYLEV